MKRLFSAIMSSQKARFQLFVKAGEDGQCVGDCPFSQRAAMFAQLTLAPGAIELTPVDTGNKPESFLVLSPEGKVPVLVDREKDNKVIPDSSDIVKYLNENFPTADLQAAYSGPGNDAASGIFQKFAAMMKNKDTSQDEAVRDALVSELGKLNTFLQSQCSSSNQCMLCGNLCEIDCQVLPKLRHVQVAGKHYKDFNIPDDFTALKEYIRYGESHPAFTSTCPADKEIIWGWSKFFT